MFKPFLWDTDKYEFQRTTGAKGRTVDLFDFQKPIMVSETQKNQTFVELKTIRVLVVKHALTGSHTRLSILAHFPLPSLTAS